MNASPALRRWSQVYYLQSAFSLEVFSASTLVAFYTRYAGFTFAQYGSIISLIFVFNWLLQAPTGALADRYGRKRSLIAGNLIYIAAMTTLVVLKADAPVVVLSLLFSIGTCLSTGTLQSMMFEAFARENSQQHFHAVVARGTSVSLLATALASIAGGYLADIHLALPTCIDVTVLTGMTIVLMLTLREDRLLHQPRHERPSYWAILTTGCRETLASRRLLALITLSALTFSCLRAGFNLYQPLLEAQGIDLKQMGFFFAGFALFSAMCARVAEKKTKVFVSSAKPLILLAGLFAASVLAVLAADWGAGALLVALSILMHQAVRGFNPSYFSYAINHSIPASTESRTTILSVSALAKALMAAIFVHLSTRVSDGSGLAHALGGISLITAIALGAGYAMMRVKP